MAIALDVAALGHNEVTATATTITLTTTSAVAANCRIIVSVYHFNASVTLSSIAGGGLTWVIDVTRTNGSDRVNICSADAPAGLASSTVITATFSATTPDKMIQASSFMGLVGGASGYVDLTGGANVGAVTGWTSGDIITAFADDLIVAAAGVDGGTSKTNTPTGPSAELQDVAHNPSDMALMTEYRIESSTGTYTVQGTLNTAAGTSITTPAVAYKMATDAADMTMQPVVAGMFTPGLVPEVWF